MIATDSDDCFIWRYASHGQGYGMVHYEGKSWLTHRLALVKATGINPANLQATHGPCNNKACFNPRHLSWQTQAGNMADKVRDGTLVVGERHHAAKLTRDDVVEIRRLLAEGQTQRSVGRQFGVSQAQVGDIGRRKNWAWVP